MALILVAATACVSIPSNSSVHRGQAVGAQEEPPLSSNVPDPPRPGAGRKEIAAGYLNAMLAYPQDASIVRQFLTPQAAVTWDPSDGLVVYTDLTLSEISDAVALKARAIGSLDARGSWTTAAPSGGGINAEMRMQRVNGEWRLVNPLVGTFIDRDYFDSYYDPFSLYFFDSTQSVLIADPVYQLLGDSLATSLVNDLLEGPTDDLDGVVKSGVPSTTSVDVSVSISKAGVAEVPMTDEILQLSPDDRRLFAAQLTWTLRPLDEINTVVVTVGGAGLDLGAGTEISVDEFPGFDPAGLAASRQLYALSGQGLVAVSSTDTSTVPGPMASVSRTARWAAVDPNAGLAAVVSHDGSTISVAALSATVEGSQVWFRDGTDLRRPSWDVHKVLWVVDDTAKGAKLYVTVGQGSREVIAPGITGKHVRSFAVSRDGVRLAALVGRGSDTRLVISVIERDPKKPGQVSLRPAHTVVSPEVSPARMVSLAWMSPTSVAVLADDEAAQRQPFEFSIDGSTAQPLAGFLPIRPTTLAAEPNADAPVAIGDSAGSLYVNTPDAQWVKFGGSAKVYAPVYPG